MRARALWMAGVLGTALLTLTGCRTDMWVQQKVKAQDNSEFYALADPVKGFDGKIYGDGSRPMPPNTIARGRLQDPNDPFVTGKDAQGNLLTKLPPQVKLTREFLNKGQEKYNIFCAQCHGRAGDGKGMIALRGQWPRPVPSLVREQLLTQPIGYFFSFGQVRLRHHVRLRHAHDRRGAVGGRCLCARAATESERNPEGFGA
jgi:cytochrome c553